MDQSFRNTILGKELHVDLLEAFMGFWDEFELPEVCTPSIFGVLQPSSVTQLNHGAEAGIGPAPARRPRKPLRPHSATYHWRVS
jgi:hypothetical protein